MRETQTENFKLNTDSPSVGYEESAISQPTLIYKNKSAETQSSTYDKININKVPKDSIYKTIRRSDSNNKSNMKPEHHKTDKTDNDTSLNSFETMAMSDFERSIYQTLKDNRTFTNLLETMAKSDFEQSVYPTFKNTRRGANINTLKFPKPNRNIKNEFQSKYDFSEMDTLKMLCLKADHGILQDFEKVFFNEAYDFVINQGQGKLRRRNKAAVENNKNIEKTFVSQNNIITTPGTFKSIPISINNFELNALLDTGASHSLINESVLRQLGLSYEPRRMTVFCASAQKDDNNVCGVAKIKLDLRTTDNQHLRVKANMLVLRNTNGFSMIIGSDIIFKDEKFRITDKYWSFHDQNGTELQIELELMEDKEDRCMLKRHNNNKIIYSKIELNNLTLSRDENPTTSASSSVHNIDGAFKNYVENNLPKNDVKYANISNEKFDTIKDVEENFPHLLLQDNYAEDHLQSSQTHLVEDSRYIDEMYTLHTLKTDHIKSNFRKNTRALCKQFENLFSCHNFDIGAIDFTHELQFRQVPSSQKMRFMTGEKFIFAEKAVEKLERAGIVSLCLDPLAISNLVMVKKFAGYKDTTQAASLRQQDKEFGYRLTQDMRNVNLTILNQKRTNAVNIDDFIRKLSGKTITQLDMTQSYFQLKLDEFGSRCTCFYLGKKVYKWNRLTQGLLSSGEVFNQALNVLFSKEKFNKFAKQKAIAKKIQNGVKSSDWIDYDSILMRYIDDLFVYTEYEQDHLLAMELVFEALQASNAKLNPKKCKLFSSEVTVLGFHLDTKDTSSYMERLKAQAIMDWPKPASLYELNSRLAALAYFQKYLPKLKEICYPLFHAIRSRTFEWDEIMDLAWYNLKMLIKADIRLCIPQPHEQLYFFSDASLVSCSQILFVERDGQLRIACANSQIFNYLDARKNSFVREGISLCQGLRKFKPYIESSEKQIIIYTDAKSLLYSGRAKDYNISCANISAFLSRFASEHNMTILHIPGKLNFLADIFSRSYGKSRFLGKPAVPRSVAESLPTVDDNFCLDQDSLYQFLVAPFRTDAQNSYSPRATPIKKIPTEYLKQLFYGATPEQIAISKRSLFEQTNNLTSQINSKEQKQLDRLRKETSEADQLFNNHFEISEQDKDEVQIDIHPDIQCSQDLLQTYNIDYNRDLSLEEPNQVIYINNDFLEGDRIVIKHNVIIKPFKKLILDTNLHSDHNFQLQNILDSVELSLISDNNGIQMFLQNDSINEVQIKKNSEICIILTNIHHTLEAATEQSLQTHRVARIEEFYEQRTFDRIKEYVEWICQHNTHITLDNTDEFKSSWENFQRQDPFCIKIEEGKEYMSIDNILYRRGKPPLIVLPVLLLVPLVTYFHAQSHPSPNMLYQTLKTKFFHPRLNYACQRATDECFLCQMIYTSSKRKNDSQHRDRKYTPLHARQAWSCDLISNLTRSKLGNTAFLMVTDLHSRYTVCYPIADKSKKHVKQAFLNHISSFGKPTLFYSDSDSSIISALEDIQQHFEFILKTAPPYSQFRNTVENSFKSLKNLITRQLYNPDNNSHHSDWESALIYATQSYNSMVAKNKRQSRENMMFSKKSNDHAVLSDSEEPDNQEENSTFSPGQIIFVHNQNTFPVGVKSMFKNPDSNPMKVCKVYENERYVVARDLQTNKYYYVTYHRIRPVRSADKILPLMSDRYIDAVFKQSKRSKNMLDTDNKIEFDYNLREKINKSEIIDF